MNIVFEFIFIGDPILKFLKYKTTKKLLKPPDFLCGKYELNHKLWKILNTFKDFEIDLMLDFLFPNVANSNNTKNPFEREIIFDKTMNVSNEYVDEHQDWPDESFIWEPPKNQKVGEYVIPGMKDVQDLIWKHQHPMTCSDKQFVTIPPLGGGLGSNLHIIGAALGSAIMQNKILIWDSYNYLWEEGPFCSDYMSDYQLEYLKDQEKRKRSSIERVIKNANEKKLHGYDCFFAPLTNCSTDYTNNSVEHKTGLEESRPIPQIIIPIIERLKIPKYLHYFYWRLCSITYLVRYNDIAKNWIKELEEDYLVNPVDEYDVSIYVRHGDKMTEMSLVSDEKYVDALNIIQKILKKDNLNVFLSTEDPNTIKWFKENTNFSLTYFDFKLGNYMLDDALMLGSILTRQMLANLKHSLFAHFVVGTLSSNFNRLIQELRMTTAGYANNYYFEVGDHTCVSLEHCRLIGEEFHMNW